MKQFINEIIVFKEMERIMLHLLLAFPFMYVILIGPLVIVMGSMLITIIIQTIADDI